ncbi:unnamed protein product [Eretmochelys imbricata]
MPSSSSDCPQMAPPRFVYTVESPDSLATRDCVGASAGKRSQHAEERGIFTDLERIIPVAWRQSGRGNLLHYFHFRRSDCLFDYLLLCRCHLLTTLLADFNP